MIADINNQVNYKQPINLDKMFVNKLFLINFIRIYCKYCYKLYADSENRNEQDWTNVL